MLEVNTKVIFLKLLSGEELLGVGYIIANVPSGLVHVLYPALIKKTAFGTNLEQYSSILENDILKLPYTSMQFIEDVSDEWDQKYTKYLAKMGITPENVKQRIMFLLGHKFDGGNWNTKTHH